MCLHIQDDHLGQPDTKDEDRSVFMDDYVPAWFLDVSKTVDQIYNFPTGKCL